MAFSTSQHCVLATATGAVASVLHCTSIQPLPNIRLPAPVKLFSSKYCNCKNLLCSLLAAAQPITSCPRRKEHCHWDTRATLLSACHKPARPATHPNTNSLTNLTTSKSQKPRHWPKHQPACQYSSATPSLKPEIAKRNHFTQMSSDHISQYIYRTVQDGLHAVQVLWMPIITWQNIQMSSLCHCRCSANSSSSSFHI